MMVPKNKADSFFIWVWASIIGFLTLLMAVVVWGIYASILFWVVTSK